MSEQIGIAIFGVTAIFLTQHSLKTLPYASIFGLAGQPFWFHMAFTKHEYGVAVLCCLYTLAWARGFYSFWLKPLVRQSRGIQ